MFSNKTVRATTHLLAISLVGTFTIAALLVTLGLGYVRVGGSLDRDNQLNSEFVSDILPPPVFLVEPMLHATWIVSDPEQTAEHVTALAELEKTYRQRMEYWKRSELVPVLKERLEAKLAPMGDAFWTQISEELVPAAESRDPVRINEAHDRLESFYAAYKSEIDALVIDAQAENERVHARSSADSGWIMAGLALVALLLIAQLVWALRLLRARAIEPLAATADTMTRMAAGDLDADERTRHGADEIGTMTRSIEVFRAASRKHRADAQEQRTVVQTLSAALSHLANGRLDQSIEQSFASEYEPLRIAFNSTLAQLGELIERVTSSAQGVRVGASEILAATDDLAQRNQIQAGRVEEAAAAMRVVTEDVNRSAMQTSEISHAVSATHAEVLSGEESMSRVSAAMTEIAASSQEITQIISVIEGIAFQTNLLALNAGVEAARAGASGKGFAVVADEVRALAQRSSAAAADIRQLIGNSTLRVGEGVQMVEETGKLLTKVSASITAINERVSQIADLSSRQSISLQEVASSVVEMDHVTQQNAAMVEQSTAAARSLTEEAESLATLTNRFSAGGTVVKFKPRAAVQHVQGLNKTRSGTSSHVTFANAPSSDDWSEF